MNGCIKIFLRTLIECFVVGTVLITVYSYFIRNLKLEGRTFVFYSQANRRYSVAKNTKDVVEEISGSYPYDVTLITQTSQERLFYFEYTTKRWTGPISVSLFVSTEDQDNIDAYKSYLSKFKLIQVHTCISNTIDYPVNRMRNIAIENVATTHFFVCDMDLWPSQGLYETILSLSSYILKDDWLAVIVPAFQYNYNVSSCADLESCVKTVQPLLPHTKEELRACLKEKTCSSFRPKTQTHSYYYRQWTIEPEHKNISMVETFRSISQEPYVFVKRSSHLPLFNETFYNYGYNKVQWIEHLRYSGYKFGQLINGFGIDVPHPPNQMAMKWLEKLHTPEGPPLKQEYDDFIRNLHSTPDRSVVYIDSTKPQKEMWFF